MSHSRPKNLNLFTIHFPLPAIISILHRLTGAALFLLLPFILWAFSLSFTESGFQTIHDWLVSPIFKLFIWLLFIPFYFHIVAGVRHLLSDIHVGSSLKGGKISALLTFLISAVLIVLTGIWLW